MESVRSNLPHLNTPEPQKWRTSPARQSQMINPPASPARSITDAIKNVSHKTLFTAISEHEDQQEKQSGSMSNGNGLDFGLSCPGETCDDHDKQRVKPRDAGMDGRGNQTADFFDIDSSDTEENEKNGKPGTNNGEKQSPESSHANPVNLQMPERDQDDRQTASSMNSNFKPDAEGIAEFLRLDPGPTNADSGIGMGYAPDSMHGQDIISQYASYEPYHANDSSFQPSLSDVRPTSDGTIFNGHEDLLYPTEDLRRQYQSHTQQPHGLEKVLDRFDLYNDILQSKKSILQTQEDIAKYKAKQERRSRRSQSATGRSTPRDRGSTQISIYDGTRASSTQPSAHPKGILRSPALITAPVALTSSQMKRRSMSSPTPPLPQATTPPVPPPPSSPGPGRRQPMMPPHIDTGAGPRQPVIAGPLHTPFPFEEDNKAPDEPDADSSAQQPRANRNPSAPRVHITEPSTHLRHSIANQDLRRKSRAMSVAVSSDTILALSVQRRHAPSGRAITRLIVPADTELAWPAISRRTSQAQGRRMSTATTNPDSTEKPEEPPNKKASDFDDGALFRAIRTAYYTELLGTSLPIRLWRRYLSARTLKRITLLCSSSSLSRAENGASTTSAARRPSRTTPNSGLTDTMSEAKLLSHFHVPNQGRARYAWVAWIHRIAGEVDADNEEFAARLQAQNTDGEKQRISAVPGGLEFVECWSVPRCLVAALLVVAASVAVCVVFIVTGPTTAQGVVTDAVVRGQLGGLLAGGDAEGRIVGGAVLGLLMFWLGVLGVGAWAWASWLEG